MSILGINASSQKIIFIALALFSVSPWASSPIALLLGFFVAFLIGNPYQVQVKGYIHLLLQISIVGLGFGLKLDEAFKAGKTGFSLTILSIFTVMILGYFLGRMFKVPKPLSYLLSSGTAICGGSAIAAMTPIIKADSKYVSLALAIVFTLNSIALLIFPYIGHFLGLTQEQFGLWAAVGIHDTSSVVGAASKYGDEALKVATTVKLARALWIIPLSIFTMILFRQKGVKIKIPWFIAYFVLAIIIGTYVPGVDVISPYITKIAKAGLNLTLFFIGSTLSIEAIKSIGIKPLLLAVLHWIAISIGSLVFILT